MTHYALSKKRDFSIQKQVLQTYQLVLHRAIVFINYVLMCNV